MCSFLLVACWSMDYKRAINRRSFVKLMNILAWRFYNTKGCTGKSFTTTGFRNVWQKQIPCWHLILQGPVLNLVVTHWYEDIILTTFSSLAALRVVKMTTFSAARDENDPNKLLHITKQWERSDIYETSSSPYIFHILPIKYWPCSKLQVNYGELILKISRAKWPCNKRATM